VIEGRNPWEKNHQPFEYDGELYAVYSVRPYRVLRIRGNKTEWVHDNECKAVWQPNTEIRGGAAPVLIGDEWWSFMHSRIEPPGAARVYWMGLYTFDAKPPFAIKRYIPKPILWANMATKPADQYAHAIFPCGAILDGDEWIISAGEHDRWSVIHFIKNSDLESQLIEV
jgi:predicted GH43/DUF377 family glycosyl hydrolase